MPLNSDIHIIQHVNLEANVQQSLYTDGILEQFSVLMKDRFIPKLSNQLKEKCPNEIVLRFESLNIDVGTINHLNWEEELLQILFPKIWEEISKLIPKDHENKKNHEHSFFSI